MKGSAIAKRSLVKIMILGIVSAILGCTLQNPSSAQSVSTRITLGDEVEPDPLIVRGMSGGEIKAAERVNTEGTTTGFCNGFIGTKPNHLLILNNFFEYLKIEVKSQTDTTIIVEGPGGVWCNDDSDDANPALEGQWQPGKYKIWVGSYQEDGNNQYKIKITGKNGVAE